MIFLNALWDYMLISSPYLVLGFIFAGIVKSFISMDWIKKGLGRENPFGALKAALLGIPLPLCSCSVIPTAITLKKSGASNASTSSFLIATPESGIDSIAMTYALMDLPMTILRPVAAFVSAMVAGGIQLIWNDQEYLPVEEPVKSCCKKKQASLAKNRSLKTRIVDGFKFAFSDLINDTAVWLTIGITLGACINLLLPPNIFQIVGDVQSKFLMLLIGIPFYICATASTPIAASLILKGMSPGTGLILLLVGPATNISNIMVMQKYIGKRGVFINITVIALVALLMGFVADWLYDKFNWPISLGIDPQAHQHTSTLSQICAIVFSLLLLKGIFVEKIKPLFHKH